MKYLSPDWNLIEFTGHIPVSADSIPNTASRLRKYKKGKIEIIDLLQGKVCSRAGHEGLEEE